MKLRDMQILSTAYLLLSLLPAPGGFSVCLFYNTTGYPCPGCGMTRALHRIMEGKLFEAVLYHPVSFVLLPVLVFFVATIFVRPAAQFYEQNKRLFAKGISLGAIVLFSYGILRWIVFLGAIPDLRPYFAEFHEPVLLEKFLHWFFH
jgi:hypothetical protein